MKLYRAKIPTIAHECIKRLLDDGDIEVPHEKRPDAEQDLAAIMEDFLRRDMALREAIKDHMATNSIPYDQFGRTKGRLADEWGHPTGEDVERFLVRQFVENLMISPNVDEVYEDDRALYKKLMEVVRGHDVDEEEIREEARGRIKNVREGTVEYEIAMQEAVREVKRRRGLYASRER